MVFVSTVEPFAAKLVKFLCITTQQNVIQYVCLFLFFISRSGLQGGFTLLHSGSGLWSHFVSWHIITRWSAENVCAHQQSYTTLDLLQFDNLNLGGEGGGRDLTMQGDKPCFSSVTDCDDVTGCIASYFVLSDLCLVFRYSWPSYTRLVRLPVIELSKQRGPQSCSGKQNVW